MSSETIDVIRLRTEDGHDFFFEAPEGNAARRERIGELARRNGNVVEVELVEMTAEEYWRIPATTDSATFFGAGEA
jgi:hypothetical protein